MTIGLRRMLRGDCPTKMSPDGKRCQRRLFHRGSHRWDSEDGTSSITITPLRPNRRGFWRSLRKADRGQL